MDGIGSSLDRGIGINMGLEFESHSMGSGIGSLAPYLGHITHLPDRTLSLNSPTNCSWLFCPVLLVKLLLELLPLMEMLLVRSWKCYGKLAWVGIIMLLGMLGMMLAPLLEEP